MSFYYKKSLGQHFLKSPLTAAQIVDSLSYSGYNKVLEIGIGKGVLTKLLLQKPVELWVVELDDRLVEEARHTIVGLADRLIHKDVLKVDFRQIFMEDFAIIGNFPYQISTQILFKVIENQELIPEVVGMFQKEVAVRVAASHGNKDYGVTSVLVQAHYNVDIILQLGPEDFIPPPKVDSAVIRLKRHNRPLPCTPKDLKTVVKTAFNQRRKTLRNALKPLLHGKDVDGEILAKRAEQLSVEDFIQLTLNLKG